MTFTPDHVLDIALNKFIAGELPGLSVASLRRLADMHERRGELLSAMQYRELADEKEVGREDQVYKT